LIVPVETLCVATGQAGAEIGADMAPTLNCNHEAPYAMYQTAHTLRGEGFDASEDGTGRGTPLVPVSSAIQAGALRTNPSSGPDGVGVQADHAYTLEARAEVQAVCFDTTQITSAANYSNPKVGDPCHPLAAGMHAPAIAFPGRMSATQCASAEELSPSLCSANPTAVAFNMHKSGNDSSSMGVSEDRTDCLRAFEKSPFAVQPQPGMQVRRLTPEECEALQGFPRSYTAIPWRNKTADQCPDGPRYKALGNSWAVPNVRWIGQRIDTVQAIREQQQEAA
jgi:DNA (cytosine-5)-methyltransferase 1